MTQPLTPARQEQRQLAPLDAVKQTLARNLKTVNALLAGYTTPERFMGGIVTAMQINPDLQACSPQSVLLASLRVAQLRLSPDPALGQAYLIPRDGKAEFQLGYRGTLQLLYRSPLVKNVRYNVVRRGDHFRWIDGSAWVLEHSPGEDGWPTTWEELVAAWAIIELVNGGQIPRVMYAAEIRRHKERGRGKQPAWSTDLAAMAAKTVLGDAARRGPLDGESLLGVNLDHQGEAGLPQQTADLEEMVKGPEAAQRAAEVIVRKHEEKQQMVQRMQEAAIEGYQSYSGNASPAPQPAEIVDAPPATAEGPLSVSGRITPEELEAMKKAQDAGMRPPAERLEPGDTRLDPKPWSRVLALNLPRVGDQIAQRLLDARLDTYERIVEAGAPEIARKIAGVSEIGAQAIVLHAERQLHPEPEPPRPSAASDREVQWSMQQDPNSFEPSPGGVVIDPEANSYEQLAPAGAPAPPAPPAAGGSIPFPGQPQEPRFASRATAYDPPPMTEADRKPIAGTEAWAIERHALRTKRSGAPSGQEGDAVAKAALHRFILDTFGVPLDKLPKYFYRAAFRWAESDGINPQVEEIAVLRERGRIPIAPPRSGK